MTVYLTPKGYILLEFLSDRKGLIEKRARILSPHIAIDVTTLLCTKIVVAPFAILSRSACCCLECITSGLFLSADRNQRC